MGQGTPADSIRCLWGPPRNADTSYFDETVGDTVTVWRYEARRLTLVKGRADQLYCWAQDCQTRAGIRVGDLASKVERIYGQGFRDSTKVAFIQYRQALRTE